MSVLISTLAPILLIILIGFMAGRFLTQIETKTLSTLSISVLIPALITDSLSHSQVSLQSATSLVLGLVLSSLILYGILLGIGAIFSLPLNLRKSLTATTLFANNGNFGLPFIAFSLGEGGLERALIYMILAAMIMVLFGPALLRSDGFSTGIQLTLKMPLFWATLLGIILKLTAFSLPFRLDEGIKILGQPAIPIALLLLGIQLSRSKGQWGKTEIFASGLRLILAPLITYGVGTGLQLQGLDLQVLILQGAMPTAVNSYVWVTEFGGDPGFTARTILLSTFLSFITLPIILNLIL